MENSVLQLSNIILALSCMIMALLFFVYPVSRRAGLVNYRISLKTLSGAYFTIAFLMLITIIYKIPDDEFFPFIEIVIASLQATLFSFTLIILFNTQIVNFRFVLNHLLPVLAFVLLFGVSIAFWGYPVLYNKNDLILNAWHPTVVLRELFVVFYLFQLIYFARLFLRYSVEYELKLEDFFADNFNLRLIWVSWCFYAALAIGVLALFSLFISSAVWNISVTTIYSLFYVIFGLCYIQFPLTGVETEVIFDDQLPQPVSAVLLPTRWAVLKQQLLDENYHLQPGITIEEMAQFLKISRTTLSNHINKEEGMNFYMWINIIRIKQAQHLFIAFPQYSIATVSEMVGFSEHSNFSRQFKLIVNTSPSEWRQQLKA